jgi:hypothetical protein
LVTEPGVYVLADLMKQNTGAFPLYRFKTKILLEYIVYPNVQSGIPITIFRWRTFNLDNQENITDVKYSTNSSSIKNHDLCFFSTSKYTYGIEDPDYTATIRYFIITVKQYNLNNETYTYYKGINEQILSEGKMFDPIASQLNGNIRCINNSKKTALGFFEVSSVQTKTYKVIPSANEKTTSFIGVTNLEPYPYDGESINIPPSFWVY